MKRHFSSTVCVLVLACTGAAASGQAPDLAAAIEAVAAANATAGTGGRPLLPPGTTVDRFEWVDTQGHIDLTLPDDTDPMLLSPANVEGIYRLFADVIDPFRATGGFAIRARIGPDGDPVPLETLAPQPPPVPQSAEYVVEEGSPIASHPRAAYEASDAQTNAIGGPVAIAGTQPEGALSGVIVYCAAGHGWTAGSSSWYLQRGLLLDMVEDYGNVDQLNYFVQYAFNAGATVVPFRPVGYRSTQVVLDNDDPGVTYTGTWSNSTATTEYYENKVTVSGVPYRWATAAVTQSATARYTPTIPTTGWWPVYCWTRDGTDRVRQTYRVAHSGGVSSVVVDHRMVGKGWVWLGEYYLLAGTSSYVEITNASPDTGVVIADAIRFGNGMGSVVGAGPGTVSGYPREEECSRYWAESEAGINAVGMSSSIWDCCSDDASDNVGTAARWAAVMNRETYNDDRWRSVYIEFHTNAAGCSPPPCGAKGTVCLVTTTGATTNQTQFATILGDKVEADMLLIDDQFEYLWGARANPYTGAYGAISTANNGNEFDATLIEVAFHDNTEDAANLLNPKVRSAVARSTLQGIVKFLSGLPGSTIPLVYLPEPPENVRAIHNGTGGVVVSWTAPPAGGANGSPATGYKIYRSTNGYGFDNGTAVGNVLTTTLTDIPAGTTTYLRVAATNAGGESMPSETLAVRVPAGGATTVLLVNAFDRVDRTQDPTQTIPLGTMKRPILRRVNSFDYVVQHAEAVAAAGYAFDSACNEVVASGLVPLGGYAAVVWFCGEESSADKTFSATEQSVVTTYLNGGGSLFVSGSEIAWELDNQAAGRPFYENMLRADYLSDSAGTYQVAGTAGGIFSDVGTFNFDPASGAPYTVGAADAIAPRTGATTALTYVGGTGNGAAVQYDSGVYRVVTLGFPFECVTSSTARNAIMARALAFLVPPPTETCSLKTIAGFEGYADGTTDVVFRKPRYSGTTSGHLATSPDVCQVTSEVAAFEGAKSCKVQWAFVDATPQRWLRLTTSQATAVPNPTIWLDQPLRLRVRLDSGSLRMSLGIRETNTGALIGTNGGTVGTIEWVGAATVADGAPQGLLINGAPGVWQSVIFKPYASSVAAFTGDGVLTGTYNKGVLEHLAFSAVDTAGPFTLYIDGIEEYCRRGPADVDYDGDVDLIDFSAFQGCFNGPNRPYVAPACVEFDFDTDGDVDLGDFAGFQYCYNGPNEPSRCE